MKTCLIGAGWALILLGPLGVAAGAAEPVIAGRVINYNGSAPTRLLAKHATRAEVLAQLGPPSAQISTAVWVYWNYRTNQPQHGTLYDTLVIAFQENRVCGAKLTSGAVIRDYLAQQDKRAPATVLREPLYTAHTMPRR